MSCCSAIIPRSRRGSEGRVDCGFLRLPVRGALETMFLEEDRLLSILPELILKRVPYRIAIRELDVPALRTIAFCLRDRKNASLAVKRFLE